MADECSYLDYTPWDKQVDFHYIDKEVRLLAWANRTGKTTAGGAECVMAGMGTHRYIHYPRPPLTIWACSIDYKQMRDSIIQALEERIDCHICNGRGHSEGDSCPVCRGSGVRKPRLLPEGVKLNENRMEYRLPKVHKDDDKGSVIRLKSADRGRKSFQGAGLPLIWLDEELPEDILKEIFLRISGSGFRRRIIWTMTAVDGLSYAYEHFYIPFMEHAEDTPGQTHPRIHYSEASIYENPYLIKDEIDGVIEKFP